MMHWERRILLSMHDVDPGETARAAIVGLTPLLRVGVEVFRDTNENYTAAANTLRVAPAIVDERDELRELQPIQAPVASESDLGGHRFETMTAVDALVFAIPAQTQGNYLLSLRLTVRPNVPLCDRTWQDAIAGLSVRRLSKVFHSTSIDTG